MDKNIPGKRVCKNCAFFEERDREMYVDDGACFRYPKTVPTDYDEWCGEFYTKEKFWDFESEAEV